MAAARTIGIEVVSDTVCPWCFIGKRRLERAVQELQARVPGAQVAVHWLPYQLNPGAPDAGVSKMQAYNDKFGPARVAQMVPAMTQTFASEGLAYSMGGLTGNTRNSHRLLAWAAAHHGLAKQNALAEEVFRGYFCEERYINDPAFLLSAAEAAGLPRAAAAAQLDNPRGEGEALVARELGKFPGVNGVPHFVVEGKHHIGGAQPPEVFVELFERLLRQQQQQHGAPAGADE